jgi:hypothetical protein
MKRPVRGQRGCRTQFRGLAPFIERLHGRDLVLHRVLHQRIDRVEESGFIRNALARDETNVR